MCVAQLMHDLKRLLQRLIGGFVERPFLRHQVKNPVDQDTVIFWSLSTAYPEALFDVMVEDADNAQFQYVFVFRGGQCEKDSSIILEPSLNCWKMGQKPTGRTLHFEATDTQMEKIYALFSAERICID